MPSDPLLNEERIHSTLADDSIPLTPNGARSLMSLVLLACYDRKVEREFMAEMIDRTAEMGMTLAKLERAAGIISTFKTINPEAPTKSVNDQIDKLGVQWSKQRQQLAEKFHLVTQCPTTLDALH